MQPGFATTTGSLSGQDRREAGPAGGFLGAGRGPGLRSSGRVPAGRGGGRGRPPPPPRHRTSFPLCRALSPRGGRAPRVGGLARGAGGAGGEQTPPPPPVPEAGLLTRSAPPP